MSPSEAMTYTWWSNGLSSGRGVRVEQPALAAGGHRHPDRAGQPLAQRPGGDLHAAGVPVLRVPGGRRAPGAQRLQVVQLQPVAGQVELDVEGQAGVPGTTARTGPGPATGRRPGRARMTFWNSRYASGARLIAVPGWPLPTFCTASAASSRTVSTARTCRYPAAQPAWATGRASDGSRSCQARCHMPAAVDPKAFGWPSYVLIPFFSSERALLPQRRSTGGRSKTMSSAACSRSSSGVPDWLRARTRS